MIIQDQVIKRDAIVSAWIENEDKPIKAKWDYVEESEIIFFLGFIPIGVRETTRLAWLDHDCKISRHLNYFDDINRYQVEGSVCYHKPKLVVTTENARYNFYSSLEECQKWLDEINNAIE